MRTDTLALEEIARRQARYVHLCAVLGVQDRPDTGDGYTLQDWERARADERQAEDARMARRGYGGGEGSWRGWAGAGQGQNLRLVRNIVLS